MANLKMLKPKNSNEEIVKPTKKLKLFVDEKPEIKEIPIEDNEDDLDEPIEDEVEDEPIPAPIPEPVKVEPVKEKISKQVKTKPVKKSKEPFGFWFRPRPMINGFILKNNKTFHLERLDSRGPSTFEFNGVIYNIDKELASPLAGWKPHNKQIPILSSTTPYTLKGKRNWMRFIWPDKEYAMYWLQDDPQPMSPSRALDMATFRNVTPQLLKVDVENKLQNVADKSLIARMKEPLPTTYVIMIIAGMALLGILVLTGNIKL